MTPTDFENHAAEAETKAQDLAMKMLDGIAAVLDPDIAADNLDPREALFRKPGGDPEVIREAVLSVAVLIASFANKPIGRVTSWDTFFSKAIKDLGVRVGFDPAGVQ